MTQPVGEYSLDLTGLADPVGLALSVGGQHYRVIGMRRGHNGDLSISWRSRWTVCGEACGPAAGIRRESAPRIAARAGRPLPSTPASMPMTDGLTFEQRQTIQAGRQAMASTIERLADDPGQALYLSVVAIVGLFADVLRNSLAGAPDLAEFINRQIAESGWHLAQRNYHF